MERGAAGSESGAELLVGGDRIGSSGDGGKLGWIGPEGATAPFPGILRWKQLLEDVHDEKGGMQEA